MGASSGIGAALARNLSERGAVLALSARSEGKLNDLNTQLGGGHHAFPFDVSDVETFTHTTAAVQEKLGVIDSVIFLAALYDPGSIEDMDLAKAHKTVDVNLKGAFTLVDTVLPIMKEQGGGQIALCGSVAGYRGLPNGQPYSATKAAIVSLAETMRAELDNTGIDVKLISPGFVRTPLTDKNDFKMPMMVEPEDAAEEIAKGLQSSAFEIHFPKKFTYMVKFLQIIPYWLFFKIAKKIKEKKQH
ncbi:MAG: SDR family NAD(P)-dependent oxidoreductase [Pseudomonadota bacterium]